MCHTCQRSGVNVGDGVNLEEDVTGSKLMRFGDSTRTRVERDDREAKQKNTLTNNLSILR